MDGSAAETGGADAVRHVDEVAIGRELGRTLRSVELVDRALVELERHLAAVLAQAVDEVFRIATLLRCLGLPAKKTDDGRRERQTADHAQNRRRDAAKERVGHFGGGAHGILDGFAAALHRAQHRDDPAVDDHHRREDVGETSDVGKLRQQPPVLFARVGQYLGRQLDAVVPGEHQTEAPRHAVETAKMPRLPLRVVVACQGPENSGQPRVSGEPGAVHLLITSPALPPTTPAN